MALLKLTKVCLIAGALLLTLPLAARPENLLLPENKIKAGLLYNFLKYTQWPDGGPNHASSMGLCIFGHDSFEGLLNPLNGRTVSQQQISVRYINNVVEAGICNLVFIDKAESARWPELQKFLEGKSILTVSDSDSFAASGGIIEFTKKDDRIQALLNMKALRTANLQVQDNLLRLVTVVGK